MANDRPNRPADRERWPSEDLVLAALERAQLHDWRESSPVPRWAVVAHLDLARGSAGARIVAARLRDLSAGGAVERSRRHGVEVWGLTAAGRARVRRRAAASPTQVTGDGEREDLPESPQHRAWRRAHTGAALELDRFERALAETLAQATRLLSCREPPARSDDWLELAERLRWRARRVGSATYCLHEWREPDDAHADLDDRTDPADARLPATRRVERQALRAGRRNILLWDERTD